MSSGGPLVIFGVLGQVGGALLKRLQQRQDHGLEVIGLTPNDADFTQPEKLPAALDRLKPSLVINAAAYTAVDQAEKERTLAFALNAESPAAIAQWCAAHEVPIIHYSTDYVYPGTGDTPWTEEALPGPLNAYGESKLQGDRAVADSGVRHLIFRTSWVYDATGKNFLRTMLRLGSERENLRIVGDQYGAPTFAGHIADLTLEAVAKAQQARAFPSGVYHLCNSGCTTWHGFANAIFEAARARGIPLRVRELEAIATTDYPTPARRPLNSRLNLSKLERVFGLVPPSWRQGLEECIGELS